jgi:hypothetical protein
LPGGLYQVFAAWRDPQGVWLGANDQPKIRLGQILIASQ